MNLLICIIIILIIFIVFNNLKFEEKFNNQNKIEQIPKLIISTYYNKNKIIKSI